MPTGGPSNRQRDETLAKVSDPFARNALRAAYHVRRFMVIYVCGGLIALALALLPTVASNGKLAAGAGATGGSPYGSTSGANANTPSNAANNAASLAASGASASGGSASAQPQAAVAAAGPGSSVAVGSTGGQVGAGTTVSGGVCAPGVRQIPYSQYAAPCVSKWSGNNGGGSWNGVTGSSITIAIRHTSDSSGPNALATQAEIEAAGGVQYSVAEQYTQQLVAYFNKTFELYGRQVKLVDFNGQGNYTNEELDQDQAGACADADALASSVHAFGVLDFEGNFEPGPFAECAPRYKLYVPEGAAYFPESFYQGLNPYVWAITMNCTLISQQFAEFAGTQLFPFNAKWAGTNGVVSMAPMARKIATYVPNNAGYQDCQTYGKRLLEQKYGVSSSRLDQYNYALDISTFPQDAQRAIVQFSASNDTSVELSCDPISPIFLTQDAVQQNYYPEWVLNGVALTDSDNFAQLWDQASINGHLFGMSQAGDTAALLSPTGEAGRVLTAAGVPVNPSSVVDYFELLPLFNQLQAAGPNLTPANIAAGSAGLPAGGSDNSPEGPWYLGPTHTLIRGSREVYWNGSGTSVADGKTGTYVSVYGGRFFQLNEYPSGQPPFFP